MLAQAARSRPDLWAHLSILIFFPKEKSLLGCETLKSLPSLENQAPFVQSTMWTSSSPCDWEEDRMGGLEIIVLLLVGHPWEIVEDF